MSEDKSKITILVVEDEHPFRTQLVLMLEKAGYRVLEAAHPNEAAHVWKNNPDIGVIVADMWLPGISGPELAGFFRRERPSIKCVFLNGLSASIRPEFTKLIRASEVVHKPYTEPEIVAAVARALSP